LHDTPGKTGQRRRDRQPTDDHETIEYALVDEVLNRNGADKPDLGKGHFFVASCVIA
jgi:hypothetical protein